MYVFTLTVPHSTAVQLVYPKNNAKNGKPPATSSAYSGDCCLMFCLLMPSLVVLSHFADDAHNLAPAVSAASLGWQQLGVIAPQLCAVDPALGTLKMPPLCRTLCTRSEPYPPVPPQSRGDAGDLDMVNIVVGCRQCVRSAASHLGHEHFHLPHDHPPDLCVHLLQCSALLHLGEAMGHS